jgi:long-chain acyl-CoA synthetase
VNFQTVPEMLSALAIEHATRPALVSGERTLSYAEMHTRIGALAVELERQGIRPGDRVGLLLHNSPEFVIGFLAIVTAGALAVPMNDHYQHNELKYFVDECRVSALITTASFRAVFESVLPQTQAPCRLILAEYWDALVPDPAWSPPVLNPDAAVMFQFSSGSTAKPKRISRTHRKVLFELNSLVETLGLTPEDRFLGVAPFSHVNGLMRSMLTSLRAGAALYPLPFDRQAVADLIEREKLTVFIAVPFMFITVAQTNFRRAPDFSSLRLCVSASAPLPQRFNQEFHDKYGIYIRQLYGSTETGTISINQTPDPSASLESVGTPIQGVGVTVMDEFGKPVETGQVGEVAVASPAAIEAYDGLPEVNRQAFREGYFFTGDLGRLDPQGRLYLQGRIKFLINKGGFKIDPREVEQLLEEHPSVGEVAVVGVTTAYGDEKVKAVVVLRAPCTESELAEYCRGKIADFKIPSLIEFRDALPKSPTGKIRRPLLVQDAPR